MKGLQDGYSDIPPAYDEDEAEHADNRNTALPHQQQNPQMTTASNLARHAAKPSTSGFPRGSYIQTSPDEPPRPVPPPDVLKAVAPLTLVTEREPIKATYLVSLSNGETPASPTIPATKTENTDTIASTLGSMFEFVSSSVSKYMAGKPPIDVQIETSRGAVQACLFFEGKVDRPIRVVVQSSAHSSANIAIPDKRPGQKYLLSFTSTIGNINVLLPIDYDGMLVVRSSRGTITLGGKLKRQSTIYPSVAGGDAMASYYRVRPAGSTATYDEEEVESTTATSATSKKKPWKKQTGPDQGEDMCEITAHRHANIYVDYYGATLPSEEGPCHIQ